LPVWLKEAITLATATSFIALKTLQKGKIFESVMTKKLATDKQIDPYEIAYRGGAGYNDAHQLQLITRGGQICLA
jgi:hypothetical protein